MTSERSRFGPLSVPRACAPWHVTHSASHTSFPRSAAVKSTSGLSAGPAAPPPPPPPREGGGTPCDGAPPRLPAGGDCGACAATETAVLAAIKRIITRRV